MIIFTSINKKVSTLTFNKRVTLLSIVVAVLIVWRGILFYYLPYANVDGPWALGQTFSLLRGNFLASPLGYDFATPYIFPYFYAILTAIPFAVLPFGWYNIFFWNLILLVILVYQIYWFTKKQNNFSLSAAFILIIGVLCSTYAYGLRYELLNTVLLFGLLRLLVFPLQKTSVVMQAIIVGVLTSIIGLSHVMAGVFAVFFTFMVSIDQRKSIKYLVIYALTIIITLSVLYLPIVLNDVQYWWYLMFNVGIEQDTHTFSLAGFPKFVAYSPILFFPPFVAVVIEVVRNKMRTAFLIKEIVYWLLMVFTISVFGRSYYFFYLVVFIVWRLLHLPRVKFSPILIAVILLIAPVLTHYTPTLQLIENPGYSTTLHKILEEVETYESTAEDNLVYVSPQVVMPIMDQSGARIYFRFYRSVAFKGMDFTSSDVILFIHPEDYRIIVKNLDIPEEKLVVSQIIPEVSGLLRPGTLFTERDYSLGLWKITIAKP